MKNLLLLLLLGFIFQAEMSAHAVAVIDAATGASLPLISSQVSIVVDNQVARVTTRQVFRNTMGTNASPVYAFPMHENASSIELKWDTGNGWEYAYISASPEDSLPGSSGGFSDIEAELSAYLGEFSLQFNPEVSLDPEQIIVFEMTYVELLTYKFGEVKLHYPFAYDLIQNTPLDSATLQLTIHSDRTIVSVNDNFNSSITNDGHNASMSFTLVSSLPILGFNVNYTLSSDELGIWGMSTLLPDSIVNCDQHGNGFVTLIIEPDASVNTEVINKNFILVIDRSGSMAGIKMQQAIDASTYIVQNLNEGDHFNIIAFDDAVTPLFNSLLPYTPTNQTQAEQQIVALTADGSTNISGALTAAIGQFSGVSQGEANIILFFTDGEASAGITGTPEIVAAVEQAVQQAETNIFLFTIGIGDDVNENLLTQLAVNNNGIPIFLAADELELQLTDFFLTINNPVLLYPTITFDPPLIEQVFPNPLPNLYKGQQLIVSGRYDEAATTTMTLVGSAFNSSVSYQYQVSLVDSSVANYSFLPKVWAKSVIGSLSTQYYITGDTLLVDSIENVSSCYGVLSNFTSFQTDPDDVVSVEFESDNLQAENHFAISPNPFSDVVRIQPHFIPTCAYGTIADIYDILGRHVLTLYLNCASKEWIWDGTNESGEEVGCGAYFIRYVGNDGHIYHGKIVKI